MKLNPRSCFGRAAPGGMLAKAIALTFVVTQAVSASAQVVYTAIVVGVPDYPEFNVYSGPINDSGQMACNCGHILFYSNGIAKLLAIGSDFATYANGMSQTGLIAGSFLRQSGYHALYFDGARLNDIGTLPGYSDTIATGVNSQGVVVGYSFTPHDPYWRQTSFVYSDGVMRPLGVSLGGANSMATAINDLGQIVGESSLAGEAGIHAFLYDGSRTIDLGALSIYASRAEAISQDGRYIAGWSLVPGSTIGAEPTRRAFVYHDSVMTNLGTFRGRPTFATGVSSAGQVVGYGETNTIPTYPFLYSPNLGLLDLNTLLDGSASGYALDEPSAINNKGWIACTAEGFGNTRALLLIPIQFPPTSLQTVRGTIISGGLTEIQASDDAWAVWAPGLVQSISEAPIDVTISRVSPLAAPAILTFQLEAHSSILNIGQKIQLFNYITNAWEQIDFRAATLTDSDSEITINTEAARFVSPADRTVKARIQYKPTGPVLSPLWRVSVDHASWAVSP